ncbi:high affinity immunoglobulin epsilon receptor subunit alpha-like [Oreochromis aureus]|uniref:high affinity immunoglobulin epsilon receptor subunit alpha-like n=1 Tax=Oreochromis aureus TaxID=47969 RepID=UPI0019534A2A|nr:high affinity immunoglobulin epsilon receptor subunit alpha-like [Oreochromis aureus]
MTPGAVLVSNRIDVKLQHSWSQIFTGETITLRCEIQGGEGKVWKYEWTAPNTNSPPTSSEYRISRVSVSHSGDYRCRGSSDYLLTGWSDAFRLTVSSSKPRATLTAQSSVLPAGGSVTLSCSVEGSAGWKFDWFRHNSEFSVAQKIEAGTSEHTISISEGGIYYCRGGRGDPVYSTEEISDVTVKEASFGCERSSFIVPFIIGLVSGIIVVLLLMCCYRKIKKPCCNSLTQSQSTNQSSASQQTANQDQTQVYSSLLHGDLSVYESIRGSGNTGSADEYNNVTSGFQLEGLDKRSRHDGTEESSDYNNVNPESASGP